MRWAAIAVLMLAPGCYLSHRRAVPDAGRPDAFAGFDAGPDAGIDLDAGPDAPLPDGGLPPCDGGPEPDPGAPLIVDVLFVIDDSGSMSEEQAALAAQFPRMVRILATGDVDEDGTPDFQPVTDLHVGVVTTNLGTG